MPLNLCSCVRALTDVRIPLPVPEPLLGGSTFFAELSLKLVLNALTTGAHILRGMVFCRILFPAILHCTGPCRRGIH